MTSPITTARQLRQTMTPEEKILWQELRAHRFQGWKFRRQHPIMLEMKLKILRLKNEELLNIEQVLHKIELA